jgi:hypothetical protein
MNFGKIVFSQILELIHPQQFHRCVNRYPMKRTSRSFSAWDQYLCMAFAQITFRESLRDIEACLRGCSHLYLMGIKGNVTRTNLAYANEHRDWRVYEALAQVLIRKARRLYADDSTGLDLDEMVYAVDASTIDLCLSVFPWASFRKAKGAIKLHTQIDLHGPIPVFMRITDGSVHDVHFLDQIIFEAGSIYVFDRGYLDFKRLFRIEKANAYFVLRSKKNTRFYVLESRPVDKSTGLRCDQVIRLSSAKGKRDYPKRLRSISFIDTKTGKRLVFLTNHFDLPAITIAIIYKSRWKIELFFKWIKQNLRIKAFYGTSENAVRTQIWIALCVYLMVACLNKVHGINESLSRILQILSVNVFQEVPFNQLLADYDTRNSENDISKQLVFNGF